MNDALALALVHFIWQGTVLAAVAAVLMRVSKAPTTRYAIGVATMLAMLAAPVMTFVGLQAAGRTAVRASTIEGGAGSSAVLTAHDRRSRSVVGEPRVAPARPEAPAPLAIVPTTWILSVWMAGVVLLSLRFLGGWAVTYRLATSGLTPVGEDLQQLAARLAARLQMRDAVRVFESASVVVPFMIGWLRPVIVLPPAALARLPLGQLEALLAHELAHVRRHDYLVNLLQTGVETLCFYHPAVWWISREVRRHREHCCDDIAVGVCDRLTYVTALSSLASMAKPQFALSSTGGSLRDRVRRLIEPATHSASPKGAWIAMLPILLVVSLVAPYGWQAQSQVRATATLAVKLEQAAPVAKPAAEPVKPVRPATVRVSPRLAARAKSPATTVEAIQAIEAGKQARERETESVLAQRRLELERQVQATRSEFELATLESQLRQAGRTLARQRELTEKGLATEATLAAAEERMVETRLQLELAQRNRTLTEQEFALRRDEVALERASATRRTVRKTEMISPLDPAAALQPQDQLTITIANEPDLPTTFTVRPDGSIRFPLLGTIPVEHSTAHQVQAIIQKLLADKGLGQGNLVVTVSAGRVR